MEDTRLQQITYLSTSFYIFKHSKKKKSETSVQQIGAPLPYPLSACIFTVYILCSTVVLAHC